MSTEKKEKMYVRIPVKPYCYRFLCHNFGIDGKREGYISLRRSRLLSIVFRSLLHHKTRLCRSNAQPARWRTREVYVAVGLHDLDHSGLDLTDEGKAEWAMIVEQMCQEDFKQFFIHMYMVEPRVKTIIEKYHSLRGYTEEDWPMESLQKIVTRMHITTEIRQAREDYMQKFNDFFTANLSALVDYKTTKRLLSTLCNSTSTTEEVSEECMPSQREIFSASVKNGV